MLEQVPALETNHKIQVHQMGETKIKVDHNLHLDIKKLKSPLITGILAFNNLKAKINSQHIEDL